MTGPPPKPYLLKKAEGNPGKRRLTPGPAYEPGPPRCPKLLKGEARKLWRELVPELHEQGLLAKVNRTALVGLCQTYGNVIAAEKILAKEGLTYESKHGYRCLRPEVTMAQKGWQLVRGFLQEFGLTPSSQGKIVVPNLKKPPVKERMLS